MTQPADDAPSWLDDFLAQLHAFERLQAQAREHRHPAAAPTTDTPDDETR